MIFKKDIENEVYAMSQIGFTKKEIKETILRMNHETRI